MIYETQVVKIKTILIVFKRISAYTREYFFFLPIYYKKKANLIYYLVRDRATLEWVFNVTMIFINKNVVEAFFDDRACVNKNKMSWSSQTKRSNLGCFL